MKAYQLDFTKIKTIADLKKIIAVFGVTFSEGENLDPIRYMLKEVELDLPLEPKDEDNE